MQTYYMRHVAPWQYMITLSLFLFVFIIIGTTFNQMGRMPDSKLLGFAIVGGLMWLSFLIARHTAIVQVAITVDDMGVGQIWIEQFLFSFKSDIAIRWDDMVEYDYVTGKTYHVFKIRLRDGSTWRLCRYISLKKDDFDSFQADFLNRVELFNETIADPNAYIQPARPFWETPAAFVLAIIMMVLLISWPIAFVILYLYKSSAMVAVALFGSLGSICAVIIIQMIYDHRKNREKINERL